MKRIPKGRVATYGQVVAMARLIWGSMGCGLIEV